jgi:ribosomal protein L25 (general stress protein Ctc)
MEKQINEIEDQELKEEEHVQKQLSEEQIKRIKDTINVLAIKYPAMEKLKDMEIKADDFAMNIATNGSKMLIQPDILDEMSDKNLSWTLLYTANIIDLGLIALGKEIDGINKMKFNVAACYFINNLIASYNDPDLEIMKNAVFDPEYSGKSVMEIFDLVDLNNLKAVK